ncbi:MAG: hypothetical protein JWR36_2884 [Glaciihabitans sp.]|jgi:hypothetical protein|nr:hypothetical protein [Glaciihabitans sp.]MDQ1572076.1 hypothetical protein [Actinomycetota bacterium]
MRFSRQVVITIAASALAASVLSVAAPAAVAAWTTSATATYTQSSVVVPAPIVGSCVTNLAGNYAHLAWPAAPATLNGSAFSSYFIEWIYGTPATPGAVILTASRPDPYAEPTSTNLTGVSFIRVTNQYANGWSSPTPTTYLLKRSTDGQNSPVCNPEKAP